MSDPIYVDDSEKVSGYISDHADRPPRSGVTYPGGSRIEMGEAATRDGPVPYLSLSAPGLPPSIILTIDAISGQPLLVLGSRSMASRTYPLDKIVRSPHEGTPGIPFV